MLSLVLHPSWDARLDTLDNRNNQTFNYIEPFAAADICALSDHVCSLGDQLYFVTEKARQTYGCSCSVLFDRSCLLGILWDYLSVL